ALVVVVAALAGTAVFASQAASASPGPSSNASLAPDFTLPDIYGHNFTLSSYRNSSVVVIEFTALSCSECQIVEKSLFALYSGYNQTGRSSVQIVTVYIEPQFGDTIPALKSYHTRNNITWSMAQDQAPNLPVSRA